MLFHISEGGGIERFEPRVPPVGAAPTVGDEPVVRAIEARRQHNYLLPRDCPRVTFAAGLNTSAADRERFLGASAAVVAIERDWYERARTTRLYCYRMPADTFSCIDECAGYFVSRVGVQPTGVDVVADPIDELLRRGIELRILPNLWALRDAVLASTLQFSMIRMRNASARPAAVDSRVAPMVL